MSNTTVSVMSARPKYVHGVPRGSYDVSMQLRFTVAGWVRLADCRVKGDVKGEGELVHRHEFYFPRLDNTMDARPVVVDIVMRFEEPWHLDVKDVKVVPTAFAK